LVVWLRRVVELIEARDPEQLIPILALRQVTMVLLAIDAR